LHPQSGGNFKKAREQNLKVMTIAWGNTQSKSNINFSCDFSFLSTRPLSSSYAEGEREKERERSGRANREGDKKSNGSCFIKHFPLSLSLYSSLLFAVIC
jgi:hypothetical protein